VYVRNLEIKLQQNNTRDMWRNVRQITGPNIKNHQQWGCPDSQ